MAPIVSRAPTGYALAVALCAAAVVAHGMFHPVLHDRFHLLPFYLAVLVGGAFGGFGPAALVTIAGVLTEFAWPAAPERVRTDALVAFGSIGLMTGGVMAALHRRNKSEQPMVPDSERRAWRAEHLHQLTSALSRAGTLADVIEACVIEATHILGGAAGAFVMASDERMAGLAHSVGFSEDLARRWRHVSLEARTPIADAIAGSAVTLASRAERTTQYPGLADADLFQGYEALAVVPLHGEPRDGAALAVMLANPHQWTPDERSLLADIGRAAMHAFRRARAHETVERACADAEQHRVRADQELADRQRAEEALRDSEARYRALAARTIRLQALTAALSEAVTVEAVARAVVRQGKVVTGAQSAAVSLLAENRTEFSTLCSEGGVSPAPEAAKRFAADAGYYSTDAVRTRQPVYIGSFVEWQRRYWRSAAHAADGGYGSAVALPLVADNTAVGVLAFHFTAPLNFDEDYRLLLTSVAQHCSQALDRARLYEAEQRARADAEAANRTKDEFLSTLSHELRTPLNVILGWAAMMRAGALEADRAVRATEAIYENALRQAQLVEDLLDVSRIIAGRLALETAHVDLGDTICRAIETMMPLAEAKRVSIHLGERRAATVAGDRRRLEQVLLNLLSNAVKFTPEGGRIEVALAIADTTVEVRVTDTGIGIDSEFLPYVFDCFRQADTQTTRTHGGLGLGLSIANHLAKAHGGRIRVDSAGRGCGTTATLMLPLSSDSAESLQRDSGFPQTSGADALNDLPDLTGVRVLVVDDEPDACEMIAAVLDQCGAEVTIALSAATALEVLRSTPHHVLLSDIGMPGEDGYALIRKVRSMDCRRAASIPAAAVTAYARDDQRQRALAAGFQVHVAKPLDPAQLAHLVARLSRTATVAD